MDILFAMPNVQQKDIHLILNCKDTKLQNLFYKKRQNDKIDTSSFSYIKIIMHNIIV